mgnify:CR=1 FL=1
MFCPSCGTRNPDGSRFCGSCGADLSGRRAGSPAAQAAAQVPASRAPIPARRAPAARIRVVAGIAAAVAVALIVAVGLSTGWFGFAKPHLTPGTYTYTYPSINSDLSTTSSDASLTAAISVSQGDRVSFTVSGASGAGWVGDARVSQAGRDHLHVQMQVHIPMAVEIGAPSDLSYNLVIPQGAPDSIVGTWAAWTTDENGLPLQGDIGALAWMKVEDDGTFRTGTIPSSDMAAVADSLKAGTFQGDANAMLGSWTRQDDGSFVLSFPDSDGALTFQYRR